LTGTDAGRGAGRAEVPESERRDGRLDRAPVSSSVVGDVEDFGSNNDRNDTTLVDRDSSSVGFAWFVEFSRAVGPSRRRRVGS
jgi:hypothetical protein